MTPRVGIVGAGLAGLTLARKLREHADVTVLEKSRGSGGRIATRYADPYRFDHGAQFFTVRDARFRAFLQPLLSAGVIAEWPARFAEITAGTVTATRRWDSDYPHYVGTPGMNAIGQALADGLDVVRAATVTGVERGDDHWNVQIDNAASRTFDWLFVTTPNSQARALLPESALPTVTMLPCYSLMLGFASPHDLGWDAALIRGADISWVSVNSSKPGRPAVPCWLVHSTNRWAAAHLDDDESTVIAHLLAATAESTGCTDKPAHVGLHRWRYANVDRQHGETFYLSTEHKLGVCGDWCIRGRIEAAFVSAMSLVDAVTEHLPSA
ncbi:MAG: FAD-dependent oxidoreductase [Pseudomonadota bacterium]